MLILLTVLEQMDVTSIAICIILIFITFYKNANRKIMKFSSDIDIDFANRDDAIRLLEVTPASIIKDNKITY
jgi:hypothetical protein